MTTEPTGTTNEAPARTDREPQPSDGPDYHADHADHAAWRDRQRRRVIPLDLDAIRERLSGADFLACIDSPPESPWNCIESDGTGLWCDTCLVRGDLMMLIGRAEKTRALVAGWDENSRHSLTDWHTPRIVEALREVIA